MSENRNRTASAAAREIQARLAAAQEAEPQSPPPPPAQGIVVTKTGHVIPPGEPIPTDENGKPVATSLVPEATFHGTVKP